MPTTFKVQFSLFYIALSQITTRRRQTSRSNGTDEMGRHKNSGEEAELMCDGEMEIHP